MTGLHNDLEKEENQIKAYVRTGDCVYALWANVRRGV